MYGDAEEIPITMLSLLFGDSLLELQLFWRLYMKEAIMRPYRATDESIYFWWRQLSCPISPNISFFFLLHLPPDEYRRGSCLSGFGLVLRQLRKKQKKNHSFISMYIHRSRVLFSYLIFVFYFSVIDVTCPVLLHITSIALSLLPISHFSWSYFLFF